MSCWLDLDLIPLEMQFIITFALKVHYVCLNADHSVQQTSNFWCSNVTHIICPEICFYCYYVYSSRCKLKKCTVEIVWCQQQQQPDRSFVIAGEFNQTNLRTVLPQLCQLEESLLDQLCRIRAETKVTPGVYSSKCSGSAPDSLLKSLPALSSWEAALTAPLHLILPTQYQQMSFILPL